MKRAILIGMVLLSWCVEPPAAQMRVRPVDLEDGQVALGLMLRRLSTTAVFMQATAHPDDETNALHVMLNRGEGVRTILASATRGDGGQNEIGPELFDALAVLRTEELAAVHRFDGTEQYFTRAVDFGYSFSIEETLEQWGRDEIIADYVRLIRTTRPDVIVGMNPLGTGGGLHHQTSALLSREAFTAAADPARYPEQIAQGLRPWQTKKYYHAAGGGAAATTFRESADFTGAAVVPAGGLHASSPANSLKSTVIEMSGYDSLLGRTYAEMGTEARSMHKCQAMPQLLSLPGGNSQARVNLMDSLVPLKAGAESSIFDGVDTSIPGLAQYVQGSAPATLTTALADIARSVTDAKQLYESRGTFAVAPAILAGLRSVRALRQQLSGLGLSDDARYNIDARLKTKEDEFSAAALISYGVRIELLADDGVVVPSQPIRLNLIVANRGPQDAAVRAVGVSGFEGAPACQASALKAGSVYRCDSNLKIAADVKTTKPYWKRLPNAARYEFEPDAPFGLPFRPTPFRADVGLTLGGENVQVDLPVQYRYVGGSLEGEKRMELSVVPRVALVVAPEIAIFPAGRGANPAIDRELRVTVTNNDKGATTAEVRLEVPTGWRATPPAVGASFTREDEAQTVRFTVRPASSTALGEYSVRAVAAVGSETYRNGYEIVEYPHIRRRQLELPAVTAAKVMDVRTAFDLKVGYVMGTGDEIPAALRGLGATVEVLDDDELASGDLNRFNAIVIGVRAYDSRDDLRANNKRILDYAERGGVVIVQYNRENSWIQYAPYPARASATRVTDENGQIQVLSTDDPVFHYPNEIGEAAWRNWVQERGTYFMDPQDPRYTDLLQVHEPFSNNEGWKKGALVEAKVGKGLWIYVGLGLWRQVTAGTDGAYQLLANLVSRSKLPGTK